MQPINHDNFEVNPSVQYKLDEKSGLFTVTVDTGAEDANRRLLTEEGFGKSLSVDTAVEKQEVLPDAKTVQFNCRIAIISEAVDPAHQSAVLTHEAQYLVSKELAGEFGDEAIIGEIKNGWFNAVNHAITGNTNNVAAPHTPAPEAMYPNVLHYKTNWHGRYVGTQNTTSAHPYQEGNNMNQYPYGYPQQPQPQISLKNLPTSWLLIGSSLITFLATLLFVFLLQGILSPANAQDASKAKFSPAKSSISQSTKASSATSTAGSAALGGLNPDALANVQKQTVTEMLADMGIDPTHNQQDLSCLVN